MMNGETFNWKMWVIQMSLDDCSKDFFVHRLITVAQGSYCSSSHVCCVLCREWLCWWWARQRPSLRSQLSGPCLWRTWLRSSSPQRWVSQKITSAGKSDMAITVLLPWPYQLNMFLPQCGVCHVDRIIFVNEIRSFVQSASVWICKVFSLRFMLKSLYISIGKKLASKRMHMKNIVVLLHLCVCVRAPLPFFLAV